MADLRMGDVTLTGSIVFEGITLDTYNKLIALLEGLNGKRNGTVETTVPPQNPVSEPNVKTKKNTRTERAIVWGKTLRALREENNLTRKDLGTMIGYNPVTIGTWETAACTPSRLAVDELNKVFTDKPLEYLLP